MYTYNSLKLSTVKKYYEITNNIYFLKSVNYLFDNLSPRYEKINHTIETGDSIQKILKKNNIANEEINIVINSIPKKSKIKNLKVGYKINILVDRKENKVNEILFPISKTKKLLFKRSWNYL